MNERPENSGTIPRTSFAQWKQRYQEHHRSYVRNYLKITKSDCAGGLLSYSGITTKVRAMERPSITDRQFGEMSTLESVSDAVEYLRRLPTA